MATKKTKSDKLEERAQLTAIALSKAKAAGADVPKPPKKRGARSSA